MQGLDWNDLRYILCLSRTGRVVGAARKLASAISPPQVYKILWKELNEEEGLWQVMPAEKKPHRASSAALAHLDELLDEALEQTFPASDAVAIDIDIERESHKRGARVLDSRTPLAGNQKVGRKSAQKH
jgi:hypothetical protein